MKKETVQEYLARGGKITKVEKVKEEIIVNPANSTTVGPANLLTLDDGNLFYGEIKARKMKKAKPVEKIDFSVLPEALRKKYLKELMDE